MGKKRGTKRSTTKVKDLPVKRGSAIKGGNDLGPDNIQKKHITSTAPSTSV